MSSHQRNRIGVRVLCVFACAAGVEAGGSARADVVFNTFGPSDFYDPSTYVTVQGFSTFHLGWEFTAGASGPLDAIVAPVYRALPGGSSAVSFELYSRGAGGLPADLLGTWGASVGTLAEAGGAPVELSLDGSVSVSAGTEYFLVLSGPGTDQIRWHADFAAPSGTRVFFNAGHWVTSTQQYPAFRLSTAPSPGTGVVGLGCLAVMGRRRRR